MGATPFASALVSGFLVTAPIVCAQPAQHAIPRLIAETPTATPGEILWLAVDFEIDEGWHTYWPGHNDTGMAMDALIETSADALAGEPVWPAPQRYESPGGILDHVFKDRMTVLVPVVVLPTAAPGRDIEFRVDARWLVCETVCLLESAELNLTVPVTAPGTVAHRPEPAIVKVFEDARARIAEPLEPGDPLTATFEHDTLELVAPGAIKIAFYAHEQGRTPRDLRAGGEADADRLGLSFRPGPKPVRGIVEIWTDEKISRLFSIELPRPALEEPEGDSPETK